MGLCEPEGLPVTSRPVTNGLQLLTAEIITFLNNDATGCRGWASLTPERSAGCFVGAALAGILEGGRITSSQRGG